jgi:hypothetical protein
MAGMLESLLYPGGGPFSLDRAIYGTPAATVAPAAPAAPAMPGGGTPMPFMDATGAPSPAGPRAPPPGMLASMFGGSAGFPLAMPPGQFPPTASSALASAPPSPPMDLSPPPAPQPAPSPLSAMASAAPSGPAEAPPVPQSSLLGRLGSVFGDRAGSALGAVGDALGSHSNTLMALGAGMAGAPTLGTGLSRGLTGAIPAAQLDRQLGNQNSTISWLKTTRGMTDDAARMVATNQQLLTQMAPMLMGAKPLVPTKLGTDALGHDIPGMMNTITGEHFDVYGRPLTPGAGQGPGGAVGSIAGGAGIDPAIWASMAPEDRLAKMDPQVQGEIKAIYEGRQSGTGRNVQQLLPLVNQVYPNFTMQDYNEKNKMQTGLASAAPGSIGGQKLYAQTSLNHLADTAESAADLGNVNGLGSADLAHAWNAVGNRTTANSAKLQALKDKAGHYGQEITKYYAGSPGGEAERQAFQTSLGGSQSSEELASTLEAELQLAQGKISKTQAQIDGTLGPNNRFRVVGPNEQKDIQRVQTAIARLRGVTPAAGGAAAPAPASGSAQAAPAPSSWIDPKTGKTYQVINGQLHQ